jgi:hypothetical protein
MTRTMSWLTAAALVVLAAAAGCSDNGSPSDLGADVVAVDQAAADVAPDLLAVDLGQTVDVDGVYWTWSDNKALEGTQICLYIGASKTGNCTQADAKGEYKLTVAASTEIGLSYDKPGYESAFLALKLDVGANLGKLGVFSDADAQAMYTKAGVSYPPTTKGNILVNGMPGAKITLNPPGGVGPVYTDAQNQFDPTLTELQGAYAMIFDLDPGEYQVDVTHPTLSCQPMTGWPSQSHAVRLPVIAGYYSSAMFSCN